MKCVTPPPNKSSASKPNQSRGPFFHLGSFACSWKKPYLKVAFDLRETVVISFGLKYLASVKYVYLLSSHEILQYLVGSSALNLSPLGVFSLTQQ
ncbi:MAG: hypothetical protein DRJ47_03210 [Thermoprotei archaeon]|nr:MAG: hypothetical protein DRJ47_03210 [Thermoprotei archaeon]